VICRSLNHSNILRLHGYFEDPKSLFLVMDLASLGDLAHWLRKNNPKRSIVAPVVIAAVARALSYLHGRGVAHRDIKPENVLVLEPTLKMGTSTFGPDDFRLGDFGCACAGNLTRTTLVGTPEFTAPELLRKPPLVYDAAHADMWALGILAYDTIVGMSPFSNFDSRETGINAVSAVYSKILAFKEPLESPESTPIHSTNKNSIWELCTGLLKTAPSQRMRPEEVLKRFV
jgi:serine/threonine protein kinase